MTTKSDTAAITLTLDTARAVVKVSGEGFPRTVLRELRHVGRDGVDRVFDSWTEPTVLHLLLTQPGGRQFGHSVEVESDGTFVQPIDLDDVSPGHFSVRARDFYDHDRVFAEATTALGG